MYFSYIYLAHKHIRFRRLLCIYWTYWNVCDYDLLCFSFLRRLNLICTHEHSHTHLEILGWGLGIIGWAVTAICPKHRFVIGYSSLCFVDRFRTQIHTYLTAQFLRICTFMLWWWWTRLGATCPYGHLYDMKYYGTLVSRCGSSL